MGSPADITWSDYAADTGTAVTPGATKTATPLPHPLASSPAIGSGLAVTVAPAPSG